MKKILIAGGVAVLAFATLAGAQAAAFNTNLTVGSTGADVVALQTFLINNGYSIPSIASGAAAKGYFGAQTKTAVQKYQAASGVPATGFVGPLTRAKLNGAPATTPVATTCPAGFTCTPVGGATTPVTGGPTGITTVGVPGTLTASLWTTPSGVVAYKGQSYDVASYKLQASASDMALQNMSLDFNARLWLYASAVTVKDESGAVVGQVNNLNASNFSELTVGSDYRLSVPVNGLVIKATQIKYLTVNITFLPTSDRGTGSVSISQAQFRAVDGTGVTDTETVDSARSFTYQGTGAGSIVVTTDASSPATGLVQLSTSAQTQNVLLAVFDVKSQNAPSTLRSLSVVVRTTGSASVGTLFSNIKLQVAGQTYSANSITANGSDTGASSSTVAFTNLSVPLAADQYVPVKILADVAIDTNNTLDGTAASTTFAVSGTTNGASNNPSVEDTSFNTLAVNTASFTSNALTFTGSGVSASNLAVSYGQPITTTAGTTTQQFTFSFNVTAGNNPIYLSKTVGTALSTSAAPAGLTITNISFKDNDTSGDGTAYFYLAPGQTKTFSAIYSANGLTSNGGSFNVNSINYGTSTGALSTGALSSTDIQNVLSATLFH